MAVERGRLFEELEFDHVAIVAVCFVCWLERESEYTLMSMRCVTKSIHTSNIYSLIDTTNWHNRHLLKIHIGHIQTSFVSHALIPLRHGLVHCIIIVTHPLVDIRVVGGVLI